jgi:hypothetical protein
MDDLDGHCDPSTDVQDDLNYHGDHRDHHKNVLGDH